MDLYCANCGEPWDISYVFGEEPEAFQLAGSIIVHCPSCKSRGRSNNENLAVIKELGLVLDGDPDGLAAVIEDLISSS